MKKGFSIITACKGRLEHLKRSLPSMLRQDHAEVIVVDFSCPQESGKYVKEHFPSAKVVSVDGKTYFSNWEARNRGAAMAKSETLVFCDADIILADDALKRLYRKMPKGAFGCFSAQTMAAFNTSGLRLSNNQLGGFQVIPADRFRALGGYDDVLQGYAAGGDMDLHDRLILMDVDSYELDPKIIMEVIGHDNAARMANHATPLRLSYLTGLLYRRAKLTLIKLNRGKNLSSEDRTGLYDAARQAAAQLDVGQNVITFHVMLEQQGIGMPRQLGYEKAGQRSYLTVEVSLQNKIDKIPD